MRSKPTSKARPGKPRPGLYIVATPIGNMDDITLRALDLLAAVDRIACEDTRHTRRLLERHGIEARLLPYHEHNAEHMRPAIMARLAHGETLALVSDAGTPLISDPGYKLVRKAIHSGIYVTALPGASAALMALTLSGLPSDRFMFAGFLPPKSGARRKALGELAAISATLIFFESARRLPASLADMAAILGTRDIAVAREMTKLHEELRRGDAAELAAHYAENGAPKGEAVVVVGPPMAAPAVSEEFIETRLAELLQTASVRDAAALLAAETGLARRPLYARALRIAGAKK
ncbi:MAG: 16S rRNA (cytidine(1402)-2'-O)-methyltransferase [Alphaproteobacteria bacterium]|jgi:16S rRNA (cytidine1402-2'-O)-methyltransferase|nr:16S rRNA (cytidine(1402)-2'-O)-methyltransferase [Alphaproteobacteria bacterium]MDP6588705.1 16S rRNA (cytidine(1402)-2'-O)-methyltransferase [Alphaproteobacteria bacterium]MDP6818871.1 16S rRNA (cytidine(1402)-2'-O)-methyltransferase [Alphaproteobacteria bacterium]